MNGEQPADEQKPPLASPANSANGSSLMAKKRKKEGLKPIITTEGDATQGQPAAGYVHVFSFCSPSSSHYNPCFDEIGLAPKSLAARAF